MLDIPLSVPLFMPLAAGVLGAFVPARIGRWLLPGASVGVLAYAIAMIADADLDASGLAYVTEEEWISELGITYSLGVDGLNLFLIALTALAWVPAIAWSMTRELERPRLYWFHLGLAETAVL